MGFRRADIWCWRIISIFAISVCLLNLMVLLRGGRNSFMNGNSPVAGKSESMTWIPSTVIGKKEEPNITKPKSRPPKLDNSDKNNAKPELSLPGIKTPVWLSVQNMDQYFNPNEILLLGKKKKKKVFLVIGIPTVKRKNASYLMDTIRGLVKSSTKKEQEEMTVVVFVADNDQSYRKFVKEAFQKEFGKYVEAGFLQVIIAPDRYYPSLNSLPAMYGDTKNRVIWRSKQSLDYSFLYYYCSGTGEYYLQLEDDVVTENGFLQKIKQFITSKEKTKWSTLEFGARGFIGMMYKAENLLILARFSRFYFWTMPIDWIFRVFNDIYLYGNTKANIRKPPLFRHVGAISSLFGQKRKLEDLELNKGLPVEEIKETLIGKNNPPAVIDTTIKDFVPGHPITNAYSKGFFWGKVIVPGSTITIVFNVKCKIKRIAALSGSPRYPEDAFGDVDVLSSTSEDCLHYELLHSSLHSNVIDIKSENIVEPIKCLKLKINSVRIDKHGHRRWLIITEIGIWTK